MLKNIAIIIITLIAMYFKFNYLFQTNAENQAWSVIFSNKQLFKFEKYPMICP